MNKKEALRAGFEKLAKAYKLNLEPSIYEPENYKSSMTNNYWWFYQDIIKSRKATLSDAVTLPEKTAKQKYDNHMKGLVEPSAIERLRFFCSLSMSGQDWLDAEQFFNDLSQANLVTLPDGCVAVPVVNINHMKESNGNEWWTVTLNKTADSKIWNGYQVYSSKIQGRAEYEAARLRHFFGQADKPNILDFDTAAPTCEKES